jgi:MFS family permease
MSKIGMMMGIGTLITAVAPAVGPTFGGAVVSSIGWRFIFIFLLPLLVISFILGVLSIQQKSEIRRTKFDVLGFIFIILGLAGLIFGFSNLGSESFMSLKIGGSILVGIIGMVAFVWRSATIDNPIINVRVLSNPNFSGHVFAFFVFQLVSLGLSFLLPNYIQIVNHGSAVLAGLIVLPGALIGAVFAPLGGRILDRVGAKIPLTIGSTIALIVLCVFVLMGTQFSNLLMGTLYFFFMIGIGLSFGNLMTNGLKQIDGRMRSHGNAILTTMQQFAGAVGTSLTAAFVAAKQTANVTLAHGTALGSHSALIFLICAMIVEFIVLIKVVDFPFKHHDNK